MNPKFKDLSKEWLEDSKDSDGLFASLRVTKISRW